MTCGQEQQSSTTTGHWRRVTNLLIIYNFCNLLSLLLSLLLLSLSLLLILILILLLLLLLFQTASEATSLEVSKRPHLEFVFWQIFIYILIDRTHKEIYISVFTPYFLETFPYKVVIVYTYNNGTFHKEFRKAFKIFISEVFPEICSCKGAERMVMGKRAVWCVTSRPV